MPIVRKIMQLHDGDIEIHTQPEQGTEVILWLPGTTRA
jgi:signal transduction histidine kinase